MDSELVPEIGSLMKTRIPVALGFRHGPGGDGVIVLKDTTVVLISVDRLQANGVGFVETLTQHGALWFMLEQLEKVQ